MCVKCERDSNEIDESDSQDEKHPEPRISTFIGIMIDESDDSENASDSMCVKCEFDSNTMYCSPYQGPFRETIESGIQNLQIEAFSGEESGTR
jgi:hypothetical protein